MKTLLLWFAVCAVLFGSAHCAMVPRKSVKAPTYSYDCDVLPAQAGWVLVTGSQEAMAVVEDPDLPGNHLLHISSTDWGSGGDGIQNVRFEYDWGSWGANSDTGTTFEVRFKQSRGGLFAQPYDGTHTVAFETRAFHSEADAAHFYSNNPGHPNEAGPRGDFGDWQVMRGTLVDNGDGTCDVRYYLNGEEVLSIDGQALEPTAARQLRVGHSGGTGPEQGDADIWIDYVSYCTAGAFAPSELSMRP